MQGLCLSTVIPNLRAQNSAISGSTSLQHLEVLKDRLQPQDESTLGIVVMTTGGNDLIHNYGRSAPKEGAMYGATLEQAKPWIEQFRDRLDTMLDLIDERFQEVLTFFSPISMIRRMAWAMPPASSCRTGRTVWRFTLSTTKSSTRRRTSERTSISSRCMRRFGARFALPPVLAKHVSRRRSTLLVLPQHRRSERPRI